MGYIALVGGELEAASRVALYTKCSIYTIVWLNGNGNMSVTCGSQVVIILYEAFNEDIEDLVILKSVHIKYSLTLR